MAKMSFRRELMAKMKIARVYSQRLKLEAVSQRLRITAEVVLGAFIGDLVFPVDAASIADLIGLLLGKIASDSVGTTDQAIFAIAKGLEDTVSITETVGFDVSKPFSDAFVVLDIPSVGAGKVASDAVSGSDTAFADIGKNPVDALNVSELQAFSVSKAIEDSSVVIELVGVNLSKSFADSVSMTDTIVTLLPILKGEDDAGSVTDTNALTFGKAPQDTAITADIQTFAITKGLFDTVYATDDFGGESTVDDEQTIQVQKRFINFAGITDATVRTAEYQRQFSDNASTTDVVVLQADYDRTEAEAITASDVVSLTVGFSRAAADAATIQDNQVALVGKGESDTLGIADSGVLLSQDYVDNNLYFADDYVGEKRTF
jgi:hypothetical protein